MELESEMQDGEEASEQARAVYRISALIRPRCGCEQQNRMDG
jgi:hypothetical protein